MRKRELVEALMEHSSTQPSKKNAYKKGKKDKISGILVPNLNQGLYGKGKLVDGTANNSKNNRGKNLA